MSSTDFRPSCTGCKYYRAHNGNERYCLYFEPQKRFPRGGAKIYCPRWCPRYQSHSEIRVYARSAEGELYARQHGIRYPLERHYRLKYVGRTSICAAQYNRVAKLGKDLSDVIGSSVAQWDVVVFFDGIRRYAFLHGEKKVEYLYGAFDPALYREVTMKARIQTFQVPYDTALEAAGKIFAPETFEIAEDPLYIDFPDGEYNTTFDTPDVPIFKRYVRDASGAQTMTLMLCEKQRPEAVFWGACCNYYRVYQDKDGIIHFASTHAPDYEEFMKSHFTEKS